jgi:ubiquitin-conjugating enzyme E2 J2
MLTPSARFQTDFKLCLSMSSYHEETWNPAWSVSTILTGMLSFFVGNEDTTGSIKSSTAEKIASAQNSRAWNRANKRFCAVWSDLASEPVRVEPESESSLRQRIKPQPTLQRQPSAQNLVQFAQRYTWLVSFFLLLGLWIAIKAWSFIVHDF